jgi:peroxiredoxin
MRMRFAKALIVAMAALGAAASASAQSYGPALGTQAPAIQGQDQANAPRDLASLMGENGLVLVFNRSADWCPYCQRQLIALEGVRGQIEQRGWTLAAITTDTVEELARFAQIREIGYPMISDEPAALPRAYDLLDPTQPPNRRHNGLPIPTILFITPDNVISARLGDEDYRVRPAAEEVVATIDRLGN